MYSWIRTLEVVLSNSNNSISIKDLKIDVTGTKYLASMKDNFVVKIYNLPYDQVVKLIAGKYYDIEIKCGYQTSGTFTLYKGGVLYISNEPKMDRSNCVYFVCTSKLIAQYSQRRINLSLKSGINMYAALKFICEKAGIRNYNISEEFKNRVLKEVETANSNLSSYLNQFSNSNGAYISTDSSKNSIVTIYDALNFKNSRKYRIKAESLVYDYPKLSTDGVSFSVLPTFNYMPGDTIVLDNALIDISIQNKNEAYSNLSYYLDKNGEYIIYQISFSLTNRGSAYSLNLLCKSKSLMSSLTGGTK